MRVVAAALVLVIGVVAFVFAYKLNQEPKSQKENSKDLEMAKEAESQALQDMEEMKLRIAELERQNKDVKAMLQQAEEKNQKLAAQASKKTEIAEVSSESEAANELAIRFGKFSDLEAVQNADWATMASAFMKMNPGIAEIFRKMEAGEEISQEEQLEIAKENQKLVAYVFAVKNKLETHASNGNGEFTHPITTANLVSKVLEASEIPLDSKQVSSISRSGDDYEQEWQRLNESYPEDTFMLKKLLDEADLKQEFVNQLEDSLTDSQQEAIFVESTRNHLSMDLMSPGLMFTGATQMVQVADASELQGAIIRRTASFLGMEESDFANNQVVFANWASALGDIAKNTKTRKSYTYQQSAIAGRAQIEALQELYDNANLSDEAKQRIRNAQYILMPAMTGNE